MLSLISDLLQQLELPYKLEYDIGGTVDSGRKCLFYFNAGKIQLASVDCSKDCGAINLTMDGSILHGKSCFTVMGLSFFVKLGWDS